MHGRLTYLLLSEPRGHCHATEPFTVYKTEGYEYTFRIVRHSDIESGANSLSFIRSSETRVFPDSTKSFLAAEKVYRGRATVSNETEVLNPEK